MKLLENRPLKYGAIFVFVYAAILGLTMAFDPDLGFGWLFLLMPGMPMGSLFRLVIENDAGLYIGVLLQVFLMGSLIGLLIDSIKLSRSWDPIEKEKGKKFFILFVILALAALIFGFLGWKLMEKASYDKSREAADIYENAMLENQDSEDEDENIESDEVHEEDSDTDEAERIMRGEENLTDKDEEVPVKIASEGVELINLYYQRLENGDLQEAYDMKKVKTPKFATFEDWYENMKSAEVVDLIEVGADKYDFVVNLEYENGTKESYQVLMKIEADLLNTISSVKVANSKGLRTVSIKDGKVTTLYLVSNGEKRKVDTAEEAEYEGFQDVYFSNSGNYLLYTITGWEGSLQKIYNVSKAKVVHEAFSPTMSGFTADGSYFYQCQGSGIAGGYVELYTVPAFKLEKDLRLADSLVFGCDGYDKNMNVLRYTLSFNGFEDPQSYIYDVKTGMNTAL